MSYFQWGTSWGLPWKVLQASSALGLTFFAFGADARILRHEISSFSSTGTNEQCQRHFTADRIRNECGLPAGSRVPSVSARVTSSMGSASVLSCSVTCPEGGPAAGGIVGNDAPQAGAPTTPPASDGATVRTSRTQVASSGSSTTPTVTRTSPEPEAEPRPPLAADAPAPDAGGNSFDLDAEIRRMDPASDLAADIGPRPRTPDDDSFDATIREAAAGHVGHNSDANAGYGERSLELVGTPEQQAAARAAADQRPEAITTAESVTRATAPESAITHQAETEGGRDRSPASATTDTADEPPAGEPTLAGRAGDVQLSCMRDCNSRGAQSMFFRDPDGDGQWGNRFEENSTSLMTQAQQQLAAARSERDPRAAKDRVCRSLCQTAATERTRNMDMQRTEKLSRMQGDGCGQSDLILAADRFAQRADRSCSRNDFFSCYDEGRLPERSLCNLTCDQIRLDSGLRPDCNVTRGVAQTTQIINQAAQMGLQFGTNIRTQDATSSAQRAELMAQLGQDNGQTNVQTTAMRAEAGALKGTADQSITTGSAQGAAGAILMAMGLAHQTHGGAVEGVIERAGQNGELAVGTDSEGNTIRGDSLTLLGTSGAAANEENAEEKRQMGVAAVASAASAHKQLGTETIMQGVALMAQGGQNIAQGHAYHERGNQLNWLADQLDGQGGRGEPTKLDGFTPGTYEQPQALPPGLGGAFGTGIDSAATEDPTPTVEGEDMPLDGSLPPAIGGGSGSAGGLAETGAPASPLQGRELGGGGGSGGGASAAALGSGGGAPAGEGGTTDAMVQGAQAQNSWSGGAAFGGYNAAGGARGAKNGTGMDLNALLSQFLGKKGDDGKAAGQKSILDYGKAGARGPASAGDENDGSILGPNSNLFMRVSTTTQAYFRAGKLK